MSHFFHFSRPATSAENAEDGADTPLLADPARSLRHRAALRSTFAQRFPLIGSRLIESLTSPDPEPTVEPDDLVFDEAATPPGPDSAPASEQTESASEPNGTPLEPRPDITS